LTSQGKVLENWLDYKFQKNFRNLSPAPQLPNLEGKLIQAISIDDLEKNGVSGIPFFCF
jgi:hypothetical protein